MIRARSLTALVLFLVSASAQAGGPIYTRFGIGDLTLFGSNRAVGMGIMGYALTGDGYINTANPAALSRLAFTRFAGGFEFRSSSLSDATGSQQYATGGFRNISIAIPVADSAGVVLYGGASPYSSVAYDVRVSSPVGGTTAQQTLSGSGGLSTLNLGASWQPTADLTVGAGFTYYHGSIQRRLEVEFDDGSYAPSEIRSTISHKGAGCTLGMTYRGLGSIIGNSSLPLTLGFVFTSGAALSVREDRILLTLSSADTSQVLRGTTNLPTTVGFGAAYEGRGFVLSGDVALQQWGSANFFEPQAVEVRNSIRAGAGIEIAARDNPATYWDRVAYRAGFAYTSSYLAVNGRPINGWALSGGAAFPIGPDARLNVDLTAGTRGTTDLGLSREAFFKVSVSVDASEIWFVTIEED